MVGSLLINNALETPIPLVVVVRHIGNKVGVATLALSHDTVFVIAKIGCAQPKRTILLVRELIVDQRFDRFLNCVRRIKR